MTYFNHFISSFEDELLLYPYGALDTEYDNDDEIEEVEEIKFGQEEFDRILSNDYGQDDNGWVTEQEYEAERLENIEYERIAHDYQVLLRKKKENEDKGIYLHDDEYSEDEYIDIGHGKNY
jgi:hypothetical protein